MKVLGKLFRGKFLAALDQAYEDGELDFAGSTAEMSEPEAWRRFKDGLYKKDWVVFAKPVLPVDPSTSSTTSAATPIASRSPTTVSSTSPMGR